MGKVVASMSMSLDGLHETQERNERAKRSHTKRRAAKQVQPNTS
jgi:hypothetical protein